MGTYVTEYQNGNRYVTSEGKYAETVRTTDALMKRRTYRLRQSPVLSVTSIKHNDQAIGESASWTEITAYDLDTETGELIFGGSVTVYEGNKNLEFIYVAGYESVPDEVEWACEELVANALKKAIADNLNARVKFPRPSMITMSNEEVFTKEIKGMLEPYKAVRT